MPSKSKPAMTEALLLTVAAERRHGRVLPLPNDQDATSAKAVRLLKSMLTAGLIEERRTSQAASSWRVDAQGKHYALRITEAGRQRVQTADAAEALLDAPELAPPARPDVGRAVGGKLAQVLSAVQGGGGASIDDLIALTGWQAHTIRASLTRLRQSGFTIALTGNAGQRRYCGAQEAAAAGA